MTPDDLTALCPSARAFVEGADLLPSALSSAEAEALVALLVARADMARLGRLAEVHDRLVAKSARRAMHLLRTRGARVAPEKRAYRVVTGPYAGDEPPSLVSMIDGRGERVVWLVLPAVDGSGYSVHEAELSESHGLIDFRTAPIGRKEWRNHLARVEGATQVPVARVSARHARHLIELAYLRSLGQGRSLPVEFARARIELGPDVAPERHPALEVAPPYPAVEARPRLAALHELPEVASWGPPDAAIQTLELELGEIATSKLLLEPAQRTERIEQAIDRAAAAALTPEYRERLAERLEETAYLLAGRGQLEPARLCNSAAALTREVTVSAVDNPFVRRLFDKVVRRDALNGAPQDPLPSL